MAGDNLRYARSRKLLIGVDSGPTGAANREYSDEADNRPPQSYQRRCRRRQACGKTPSAEHVGSRARHDELMMPRRLWLRDDHRWRRWAVTRRPSGRLTAATRKSPYGKQAWHSTMAPVNGLSMPPGDLYRFRSFGRNRQRFAHIIGAGLMSTAFIRGHLFARHLYYCDQ